MRAILVSLLFGALSLNALAAPERAPAPDLRPTIEQAGSSFSFQGEVQRLGDREALRLPRGSADELGLSVGSYELSAEDGALGGELRVLPDGSMIVLPQAKGGAQAPSHERLAPVIVVVESDEECDYYTIIVRNADGSYSVYFFTDCTIVVTA